MAEQYTVDYNIRVNSQSALDSIRAFQEATAQLKACTAPFNELAKTINSTANSLAKLTGQTYKINISTTEADKRLNSLLTKIKTIQSTVKGIAAGGATTGETIRKRTPRKPATVLAQMKELESKFKPSYTLKVNTGTAMNALNKVSKKVDQIKASMKTAGAIPISASMLQTGQARTVSSKSNKNLGYKVLGDARMNSMGIGYMDMFKGMGVAYGLSGLGTLMGNVVKDSAEYDNILSTTKNILQTHDYKGNFNKRFKEMSSIIRNVGIETKFTAPQVADASKFLAMAGFNLEDINNSIRPISDIALVGDTDLGETADVVTNIMTSYGINTKNISRVADIMTMTFTKSNTTLMELAEAYKYAGSILHAADIPFEEATAAFGILGDAGVKSSQAGTTMRTIAANIINPTGKQQAAWQAVGVNRKDSQGNFKSLPEIFQELKEKDLGAEAYYRLFHKTAVQGAVALAANVDKWNDIIYDNFLSEGLAHKLADEKKNTVQGLWAQLTSAFTENGLQAFEGLQNSIKNLLKDTIDYLKTPEAVETVKGLGRAFLDMIQFVKKFTTTMASWYRAFEPMIKQFFKLQMYLVPILAGIKAIKAVVNVSKYFWQTAGAFGSAIPTRIGQVKTFFGGGGGDKVTEPIKSSNKTTFLGTLGKNAGLITQIAATLGIAGVLAYDQIQDTRRLIKEQIANTNEIFDTFNGLNISKHASEMDKYLAIVYNDQLSVNSSISEHIRLIKERKMLESRGYEKDKVKYVDSHRDQIEETEALGSFWGRWFSPRESAKATNRYILDKDSKIVTDFITSDDLTSVFINEKKIGGRSYSWWRGELVEDSDISAITLFAKQLFGEGYDIRSGSPTSELLNEGYSRALSSAYDLESLLKVINEFKNYRENILAQATPGSEKWTISEVKKQGLTELDVQQHGYHYLYGQAAAVEEAMQGVFGERLKHLEELSRAYKGFGNKMSLDPIYKVLVDNGAWIFGEKYGTPFTDEWNERLGKGKDGKRSSILNDKGEIVTVFEIDTAFADIKKQISNLIKQIGGEAGNTIAELFKPILNNPDFKNFSKPSVSTNPQPGDEEWFEGNKYTYSHSNEWVDQNGNVYKPTTDSGHKNNGNLGDQLDYKSQYKSSSAAPKQIIVNIQSLLGVDKIDLSNKDNAVVIENVKEQLAQALIDVVHDFDSTFHS